MSLFIHTFGHKFQGIPIRLVKNKNLENTINLVTTGTIVPLLYCHPSYQARFQVL